MPDTDSITFNLYAINGASRLGTLICGIITTPKIGGRSRRKGVC